MVHLFHMFPYEITGPIKFISEYLTDVKFLWNLSITCSDCYSLFWVTQLYYKMLVQKCRAQPEILQKLISRHYPTYNSFLNTTFIADVVRANGKAILFIPSQLDQPLINVEIMQLALKQYPKLYERINGLRSSFHSNKYNYFTVQHEYLNQNRELILQTEVRSCLNTNVYHMDEVLSCFCANCQYNRIIKRQNR